jgi:hypothetical protein
MLKRAFQISTFLGFKIHNIINENHIPFIQWIFSSLNIIHPISQNFKHTRLTPCKIKVHIHEFCRCDKKCGQNSKVYYLLAIHDFDLIL